MIRIQGENVYQASDTRKRSTSNNEHAFFSPNFDGDDLLKCFNLRNSVCAFINY